MNHNRLRFAWLSGFALLLACGGAEEGTLETAEMPLQLLTSIALPDGASVEFHEPLPGEMVAIYVGKDESFRDMFEGLDRGTMTHVGLYEAISGAEAPAALAEAEARLVAARQEVAEFPRTQDEPDRAVVPSAAVNDSLSVEMGSTRSNLTATDFSGTYCPNGWGYLYCWTNRTGSASVTRTTISMYTYLNPYRGSVNHKLQYKNIWGNWVTYVSQTVPEDNISYISRSGIWSTRRTKVTQASGDGYHVSIYGTI